MADTIPYHNSNFDIRRAEIHSFVAEELGLPIFPRENLVLATHADLMDMRRRFGEDRQGGYSPRSNFAIVAQIEHPLGPRTSRAMNESMAAHEAAHSGSHNIGEHYFFNEVVPGIVENARLEWLANRGLWTPSGDNQVVAGDAVASIPGAMNYVDAREGAGTNKRLVTSGLAALAGLRGVLQRARLPEADVLAASTLNGNKHFVLIKGALDSLDSSLVSTIESTPETMNGVIQATAAIQNVLRKHSS